MMARGTRVLMVLVVIGGLVGCEQLGMKTSDEAASKAPPSLAMLPTKPVRKGDPVGTPPPKRAGTGTQVLPTPYTPRPAYQEDRTPTARLNPRLTPGVQRTTLQPAAPRSATLPRAWTIPKKPLPAVPPKKPLPAVPPKKPLPAVPPPGPPTPPKHDPNPYSDKVRNVRDLHRVLMMARTNKGNFCRFTLRVARDRERAPNGSLYVSYLITKDRQGKTLVSSRYPEAVVKATEMFDLDTGQVITAQAKIGDADFFWHLHSTDNRFEAPYIQDGKHLTFEPRNGAEFRYDSAFHDVTFQQAAGAKIGQGRWLKPDEFESGVFVIQTSDHGYAKVLLRKNLNRLEVWFPTKWRRDGVQNSLWYVRFWTMGPGSVLDLDEMKAQDTPTSPAELRWIDPKRPGQELLFISTGVKVRQFEP